MAAPGPTGGSETLVLSAGGASGGGLFVLEDGVFRRVDSWPTAGLRVAGSRLVRVVRRLTEGAEIVLYGEGGVEECLRIDALTTAHDVLLRGDTCLVACPGLNAILQVTFPGGEITRLPAPFGSGDAWHLNCLTEHEGRLVVCAFGRFATHREWDGRNGEGHGVVFEWETGRDLVTGLRAPHHPRWVDGAWIVCDSFGGELVRADPETGRVTDRVRLAGFTRGLAVGPDVLFVGESSWTKGTGGGGPGSVAVLDRKSLRVLDRIEVGAPALYDLVLAGDGLDALLDRPLPEAAEADLPPAPPSLGARVRGRAARAYRTAARVQRNARRRPAR